MMRKYCQRQAIAASSLVIITLDKKLILEEMIAYVASGNNDEACEILERNPTEMSMSRRGA
jgi:hypothetical protein